MVKKSNLKINFIYNLFYQILLIIAPLITAPYVSRVLGSSGFGVFSYTYAISNVFAMFGMLGIANYGNRTIAAFQDDIVKRSIAFWNILALQIIASLIVILAYIFFIIFYFPRKYEIVAIIQILTVLCSVFDINWYFFGVEKFKLTITRNSCIKILNVVLIFIFVKDKNDVALYTLIIVGSLLLSNIAIWPFLKKEVYFVKPTWNEIRKHIPQSMALFMPVIAITMYTRVDKIMVGTFSSMNQIAFFENTEKIMNIPNSLIAALGTVMLPRMSNLFAKGNIDHARRLIAVSMEFVSFLACGLSFGVAGIAPEFSVWFFGNEFKEVGPLLMAISPAILFIGWANVIRTQYLIPLHRDSIYIISVWLGAITNIIINIILVIRIGSMGAVIGTVVAEGTVMIYQLISVKDDLPLSDYFKTAFYFVVVGFTMWIVIRISSKIVNNMTLKILVEVFIGGFVYLFLSVPYFFYKHNTEVKKYLIRLKKIGNR